MPSKKELCRNWRLYIITDPSAGTMPDLIRIVSAALKAGAKAVQLRDKFASDETLLDQARQLLKVTLPAGVPLIINDRVRVAKRSGAQGVHLGQEDGSLEAARQILGPDAIIGRSTHSPEQALRAEKDGFDYIGVGPVFGTPTKPSYTPVGLDLVRFAAGNIHVPFVAIGGINESNVSAVRQAGAQTVAVVRAVMGSRDPRRSVTALLETQGTPV